ncbi:hypothetical protein ONR75_18530 [Rhodopseudomonas sp. P2A-2r]|nr:hypothetical protein [Rhodopseudomonas sp. P2A-2r]UZE47001.1 hypothetical protein ONR75_18530 [Rhodopseudomonas sp. P2A-2r]
MKEFNQLELFEQLEMFFEECRQVREQAPPPVQVRRKEIVDPWPPHMRFD